MGDLRSGPEKFRESDFDKFRADQEALIQKIKSIGYHSPEYGRFLKLQGDINSILDEVVK